jgi:hypothetical protein
MYFHNVSGTVIVPETPGPSCIKPKSVVTVAESPCSPSETDSSFGVTGAGKLDKSVGKDKELENHPECKQDIVDDSIYEAETQCDIDCLDVSEHPANKSHGSSVTSEGKICASALDEEEDMFEAETQCEEPSFRGPVKLFSPSGQKKQDLVPTSEIVGAIDGDSCDVKMQHVLNDGVSETVQHDVVSNEKLVLKSSEQESVKVCNVNQKCKVDCLPVEDVDDMSNNHDEIYGASAISSLGDADVPTSMGERGAVGLCSKQTKDCIHDDGSLNSHIVVKNLVQGKVGVTDSNTFIKRETIGCETGMAEVPSSDIDVQQKLQLDRQHEKINSTGTKVSLDISCNKDNFDHSLLEGDDEFFTSPAVQTTGSEEATSKTNEKFSKIYQEGSKSKRNCTNSDDSETHFLSFSKQCTTKQLMYDKMLLAGAASEKCSANKVSRVQAKNLSGKESDIIEPETPSMKSLSCNNKEAAKLCDESGDETDPDDIFEACTQIILPPVSNRKVISNLSETSVTIHKDNMKPATQSFIDPQNAECQNKITEKQGQVVEFQTKNKREFIKPQDSLKEHSLPSVSNKSVVFSAEKEETPTQISSEFKDSNDDIYEALTQLFTSDKNRDLTKLPVSSREETTGIQTVMSSCRMEVPRQLNSATGDCDNEDSIFEAVTQILETTNTGSKDVSEPFPSFPVKEKKNAAYDYDDEDSIFEAATQILGTSRSGKEFPEVSTPSVEEHINSPHEDSDTVSEDATQTVETRNRASSGFTNASCISSENDKVNKPTPSDNHKAGNLGSLSGNEGPMDLGDKAHVADKCSVSDQRVNYPGKRVVEFQEGSTSVQEPIAAERKKQDDGVTSVQRYGDEKHELVISRKSNVALLCYKKGRVAQHGMAEPTHDTTACAQKLGVKEAKDIHDITGRAQGNGDRECGLEEPNKQFDSETESRKLSDFLASSRGGESVISGLEKQPHLQISQKEDGEKPEVEGSGILGDTKSSFCDKSNEETDRKLIFEANSQKMNVKKHVEYELNIVQKTVVPVASGEATQRGDTKSTTAESSCSSEEANAVTLAVGSVSSKNLLKVPPSECDIVTAEVLGASTCASKINLESEKFIGQAIDIRKSSVSYESALSTMSGAVRSVPQDQRTENGEPKLNTDFQECIQTDCSKGIDESQKTLVGTTEIALVSRRLEVENSYVQNENDFESCSGKSKQVVLEHHGLISEERGRVVDVTDTLMHDSSNDMSELIIPPSQDTVRESEAKGSPFDTEELIPSKDETLIPTVRERLNVESRSFRTSAEVSKRHLPGEGPIDVSVMSKTAAGITRTRRGRRELHPEYFAHSDSKYMASDIISFHSASGCSGEIQQSGTELVVGTDEENSGKGRKSKAARTTNREQDKAVASGEWSSEARGGRSSKKVIEPVKGDKCKVTGKIRKEQSVNKNEDVENAVATSSRPSRQRKMTWKVQDSFESDSSQGSIRLVEKRPKKRSRGSSGCNSNSMMNESREWSRGVTTRSRNVSQTKSPLKTLLKSSEDRDSDMCKEVKKSEENGFVTCEQNVSRRKSTRQRKVGNTVASATVMFKDQSSQRMTRQNSRKVVSKNSQKQKNEETVTDVSSSHLKREDQVFPDEKFQRNSSDICSPESSKSDLRSCKDVSSDFSTRVLGRKRRQTANVGPVLEQSTGITDINTLSTEDGKQLSVLKKPSCFSVGSFQECTGRNVRRRTEVTGTSQSCLKEETASVSVRTYSRTQQGVKRTILRTEGDDEHLPAKQTKTEKRLTQPHSSSESRIQSDVIELVPLSTRSRSRGKVTSPEKSETASTVKQDTELGEREKTNKVSKTEEDNKSKNEPLTPKSCMGNLSEGQDTTLKRASRRGTPQNGFKHNSQKVSLSITSVC